MPHTAARASRSTTLAIVVERVSASTRDGAAEIDESGQEVVAREVLGAGQVGRADLDPDDAAREQFHRAEEHLVGRDDTCIREEFSRHGGEGSRPRFVARHGTSVAPRCSKRRRNVP
jgi:hypothetical protein